MKYVPTIGLEIHAELKTKTKMFCPCLNNPDEKTPNLNVCPVCTGHPGVLPTINKEAVKMVLKMGMALKGNFSVGGSKFDRKNYFYPDLPKAYQISQYDQPLISGGVLNSIRIRRIHLEEDTARLLHELPAVGNDIQKGTSSPTGESGRQAKLFSLVDFNRSSIPLMELVTEPDIKNGEEAVKFAKELQLILRYLDVSDADMEKGHMRIEANISIRLISNSQFPISNELGTKVEVKNINSFKAVGEAINFEIKRQAELLEKGEKVVQETRGWNEKKKETVSQRVKEEAHDYRYFPEPDLPPLDFSSSDVDLDKLREELIELPFEKRDRFQVEYNLRLEQADVLVQNNLMAEYFEEAISELKSLGGEDIQLLYNYFVSDLRGLINEKNMLIEDIKINPHEFAHLVFLIFSGKVTSRTGKDLLKEMFNTGEDPEVILKSKGLDEEIKEGDIVRIVEEIITANQKAVEDYKKGQENALQFLVGQAMSKLKGRANPQELKKFFKEKI